MTVQQKIILPLLILSCLLLDLAGARAEVPSLLNYQGILADGTGQPVTGSKSITFSLYNQLSGGTAFWSETKTVTLDSNGRFSESLGSITPLNKQEFTGTTFIGIKVESDPELAPRQQLTSVAYALQSDGGVPVGSIIMWSGTTIPTGWALCDGTPPTPNLRDKFIVGAGSTKYPIGMTGGEETHVLSQNEMPSHTHIQNAHSHGVNDPSHRHTTGSDGAVASSAIGFAGANKISRTALTDAAATGVTINGFTAVNQNTGLNAAHENRPPFYALAFIMKIQ